MARCPFARWAPDGATPGGPIVPRVAILHCTAVDFDAHPHGGLEWHFEIDFAGNIDQLVDTERRADANNKANEFAVSIETWGRGEGEWTAAQLASIDRLLRWLNATHPTIPLARCTDPYGSGIGYHTMFGAPSAWTPVAKSCPGPIRKTQFDRIVLPALATQTEDDDMFSDTDRQELHNIQAVCINTETRLAQLAELVGDIATGDLTADEIRAAVADVLKNGVG